MKLSQYTGRAAWAVAIISGILIVVFGLRVSLHNKSLAAENALLRKSMDTRVVIRNFELDILPYVTQVGGARTPVSSQDEKVMLFARDGCPYCAKQMPIWKELVGSSIFDRGAEFWLVSLGKVGAFGDLSQLLTSKGQPFREFTAPDVGTFALCTGIRGVPTTVVTKSNQAKLVYLGEFTQEVRERVFAGIFADASAAARFPSIGLSEPLIR